MNNNYFDLFGIPLEYALDKMQLQLRYYQLQKKFHPDNYVSGTAQEKRLAVEYASKINEAYKMLCDPLLRAIYLLKINGIDVNSETDTQMPQEFLIEQMELHEAMAENPQVVKEKVSKNIEECEQNLNQLLSKVPPDLMGAKLSVRKMMFYVRLQEDLSK